MRLLVRCLLASHIIGFKVRSYGRISADQISGAKSDIRCQIRYPVSLTQNTILTQSCTRLFGPTDQTSSLVATRLQTSGARLILTLVYLNLYAVQPHKKKRSYMQLIKDASWFSHDFMLQVTAPHSGSCCGHPPPSTEYAGTSHPHCSTSALKYSPNAVYIHE